MARSTIIARVPGTPLKIVGPASSAPPTTKIPLKRILSGIFWRVLVKSTALKNAQALAAL